MSPVQNPVHVHGPHHGATAPPNAARDPSSHPEKRSSWFQNLTSLGGLISICVLLWAYSTGRIGSDHRAELPPDPLENVSRPEGMLVTAEPVTIRPVKRTIEAVGTLYGFEEVVVSAKVEGRVLRVLHDVSDRVAPRELLLEIDPTDLKLAVEQAESNLHVELAKLGLSQASDTLELTKVPTVQLAKEKLELARVRMERIQSLAERQATTQEGLDNAISEFRMAGAEYENQLLMARSGLAMIRARQAALSIAQQQLADCSIRAPVPLGKIPGQHQEAPYVITRRTIAEGSFVRVGDEVFQLVIDGVMKLRLSIPERYSAQIQLGQNVEVLTPSSPEPFNGTVTMINPSVDVKSRTFQVEVQVVNDRPGLKPGGFAKAIIEVGLDPEARTIPVAAMTRYAGVIKLFVVEDGRAREIQFVPGVQTSEWIEVAEPRLDPDAVVITSGHFALSTGVPVSIREPQLNKNEPDPVSSPD